jgi:hypothetical protein
LLPLGADVFTKPSAVSRGGCHARLPTETSLP